MSKVRSLTTTPKIVLEQLLPKADQIDDILIIVRTKKGYFLFNSDMPQERLALLERYLRMTIDEELAENLGDEF